MISAPVVVTAISTSHRESLQPLAALAMRESRADGYALFRSQPDGRLVAVTAAGTGITEEVLSGDGGITIARFPLRSGDAVTGLIAFAFEGRSITLDARAKLTRMAAAIQQVWQLSDTIRHLAVVAARIGELEVELADSKIAARTHGFLQNPAGGRDLVDTAVRHVEGVLKPNESRALLEQRAKLLKAELEERMITAEAKRRLQVQLGVSEEEAHFQLRQLSRATRRPIRNIALDILDKSQSTV